MHPPFQLHVLETVSVASSCLFILTSAFRKPAFVKPGGGKIQVCFITYSSKLHFFELMPNLRLAKVNGIIVCQVIHLKS